VGVAKVANLSDVSDAKGGRQFVMNLLLTKLLKFLEEFFKLNKINSILTLFKEKCYLA
jgi:hypothetical protein